MVEMIQPKPLDLKAIERAIDAALEDGIKTVEGDIQRVTANWKQENKPTLSKTGPRIEAGDRVITLKTTDAPFVYVDLGTKGPYPIPKAGPKPGGLGPFQIGYVPMTVPGSLRPLLHAVRYGPWVSPKQVMHPGIKARGFFQMSGEKLDLARLITRRLKNLI